MTNKIDTRDELIAALVARYPALEDRERYAALWAKAERGFRVFRPSDPIPFSVLVNDLRLDTCTLDEANMLAKIDIIYAEKVDACKEDYAQRMYDLQHDLHRELADAKQDWRKRLEAATYDIMRDRADDVFDTN